jgi:hypothetical protein
MSAAALPPVDDEPALRREGERITQLIDDLGTMGGAPIRRGVEELVRRLLHLYGAGLTRLMRLLPALDEEDKARICGDALVSSLLLLHHAHPAPAAVHALDPGPEPATAVQPDGLVQIDLDRSRIRKPEAP